MHVCIAGRKATSTRRKITVTSVEPVLSGMAFRRGLATNLHDLGVPDKTIQGILRHANVQVTQNSYIKTLDSQSIAAMRQLESLVDVKMLSGTNSGSDF
jgi:integrase